jgi:hypothetical protein
MRVVFMVNKNFKPEQSRIVAQIFFVAAKTSIEKFSANSYSAPEAVLMSSVQHVTVAEKVQAANIAALHAVKQRTSTP